jgi:glycogen debranching enzyme
LRFDELSRAGELPYGPYFGSVDSTPLFLLLLAEYYHWTNDRALARELLPAVRMALQWMEVYGDPVGTGFLAYEKRSAKGLVNQGWKDSWDAVRFADGTLAQAPIALCEVQGYVYAALVARSHIATEHGDLDLAGALRARAVELKRGFNRDFWLDEHGWFAMGLDRDKRPLDAMASNMGHCLWTGIVDEEKAPLVAKHLLSDACFSGWGIRTLADTMAGYNPISYHNGSVWPHDNAISAAGLMRYGFVDEAHRVIEGQVHAGAFFGNRMPELFAGLARGDVSFPVSYPTSCSPQAWAAASPLLFLRTMLRFEPDIRNEELHLAPVLPDWIGTLRLEEIPLMGGHLSIEVEGAHLRTLEVPRGLTIVRTPRRPTF